MNQPPQLATYDLPPPESPRPWWKKKRYAIPLGIFIALAIIGAIVPPEEESTPELLAPEATPAEVETPPTSEPATVRAFASREWEKDVAAIVADESLSPIATGDAIWRLTDNYELAETDIAPIITELVSELESGALIANADDPAYQFRLNFMALIVERNLDDSEQRAEDSFAFDYHQITRDLGRKTESADSDFIKANLQQLQSAVSDNNWQANP